MSWALITGASSGIGEEFARQLAADGYDLVLVARSTERLETLPGHLREKHSIQTQVLTADLATREGMAVVESRLSSGEDPIDLLVNNAGFGTTAAFVGGDIDGEQQMLGGDVIVLQCFGFGLGALDDFLEPRRDVALAAGAGDLG